MASRQDFWEFFDDFAYGAGTFGTSASAATPWRVTDASTMGTPVYTAGTDLGTSGGAYGIAHLAFDSQAEAQNVCLSFGDVLTMDINDRLVFETRLKQGQATADSTTSFAFGLIGDRSDTIDSIAQNILFRYIGDNVIVCETDDGTTDLDDKATGLSLTNAYKYFKIDAQDLTNVKFYMGDAGGRLVRVAKSVTFDVSAYAGALQPVFQLQKTSDTNTDSVQIDYVRVTGRRIT
jgi:hypothetical protein